MSPLNFWNLKNVSKNIKDKILMDGDFVDMPKFGNSLNKMLDAYPDGVPETLIKKALHLTQKELDDIYNCAIIKLRHGFKVDQ
jgi:hypothetical protein